ncbi:MAG: lysophospholipase [Acidimicrobiia bacterium]
MASAISGGDVTEVNRETSRTGAQLATRDWIPEGPARAGIVIVHGAAEHSGRYEHVGSALAARGYATYSYDHRGHGESSGPSMHVDNWREYVDDLEDRFSAVAVALKLPMVLYGHSLGGLIALDYCLSTSELMPDLLVLSGPALEANVAGWKKMLAPVLARIMPRALLPLDLEGEQLSRDPRVGEAYSNDPLVATKATARFGAETLKAQARVAERIPMLTIPTLLLAGGSDTIIPPQSSLALAEVAVVERRLYPNLRHEIHNEPEGPEVVSDIADWIDAQLEKR